jgi:hypothetical protein
LFRRCSARLFGTTPSPLVGRSWGARLIY